MKPLRIDARERPQDPPTSCTVVCDRILAALLQRLRDGTIDPQTALQLKADLDLPPALEGALSHARGCTYCQSALRTGVTRSLFTPDANVLHSPAMTAESLAWAQPEEAIAVLTDRGRRAGWAGALRLLAKAAPLDRTLRRRALVALRSCKDVVRQGTALWELLEDTERTMIGSAQRARQLRQRPFDWPLVLATVALIVCLGGWLLNWSRGRRVAALLAGQRVEAAAHERREAEIGRQLSETRRRWTKAEGAVADLRAKLHERAEAPVRVAVLQLFPAVTRKAEGEPLPDALRVPRDASIVTFSLASQQEIGASDQAVFWRSGDAAPVATEALLGQGTSYTVSLPAAKLQDGDYTLRLIRGTHRTVVETYSFRVSRVDR